MFLKPKIILGGGDARRLGIRFLIIERISKYPLSSLFNAYIYAGKRQCLGTIRIYRLIGWMVALPAIEVISIIKKACSANETDTCFHFKIFLFKSIMLIVYTMLIALYVGLLILSWFTCSHIDTYYLAKEILWLGLFILLRHVLIVI